MEVWAFVPVKGKDINIKSQMEKAYPGFEFLDAEVKYNGINAAFYIYARMVKIKRKEPNKK